MQRGVAGRVRWWFQASELHDELRWRRTHRRRPMRHCEQGCDQDNNSGIHMVFTPNMAKRGDHVYEQATIHHMIGVCWRAWS